MGPAVATKAQVDTAYQLGRAIAQEGWVLLTGGRNVGVMDAACRGAKSANGLTVGILPTETVDGLSSAVDVPIVTGLGSARNNLNVLSSQVVVACGMGAGTASEVALALKAKRPVILLEVSQEAKAFLQTLSDRALACPEGIESTIRQIHQILNNDDKS